MTADLAVGANLVISVAYAAIFGAILLPLVRAGQVGTNRLGTSTAAIFFSCAVGHGFHAYAALAGATGSTAGALTAAEHGPALAGMTGMVDVAGMAGPAGTTGMTGMTMGWPQAVWDAVTACVAVTYWTQRRTYGSLMQGAALFEGLEQRRRLVELEHREALAGVRAHAEEQREALLRQTAHREATFRTAFESALVGMYLITPDGCFIEVNEVFARMTGRSREELGQLRLRDVVHPDEVVLADEARRRVLDGEVDDIVDRRRFLHADGTVVHVDLSSSLIRDADGQPLHFASQAVDVTARELARRERDAHEQMLSGVIANSQSMIYVKDLDGRYLLTNRVLQRTVGRTEDELLGRTDAEVHEAPDPAWAREDRLARGGERHAEHVVVRSGGERVVYEAVRFPLHDEHGALYGTCGISLDVTARRQVTAQREAAAAAVAEAARAALEATEAKARFLATMSHEIRTPMNAVIGMSGLLADTHLDPQQEHFVSTIRTSGDALLAVINDVLDFSKLDSGELHLEEHPFDLAECLDESLALVAGGAGELDLVAHLGDGVPAYVRGDSHRLRQVLVNLVGNAVKFTRTGDVLLSVERAEAPAGAPAGRTWLTFAVRDTGIGIPAEAMHRLFTSFSQVDASTTRVYGGTGLGLAISRSIVQAMGGEIGVASEVGSGSEFRFTVGLGSCPQPVDEGGATGRGADLRGARVLLVDDNETNRRILRLQLEAWHVRCVDVADPREALRVLAGSCRVDALVLDMHMPEMDGVQLGEQVRRLPHRADLPMVLLTSLGWRPPAASAALFAGFHTKPVRAAVLRDVLADVLSGGTGGTGGTGGAGTTGAAPADVPAPRPAVPPDAAADLRLLLAEDNLVNQQVADLMLRQLGIEADIVGDGQQAVDAAREGDYDVVLMDLHMPVLDGLGATRALRQLPLARQPRVVAMTASSSPEDRAACEAAGMDDYLTKPVRSPDLAAVLAAVTSAGPREATEEKGPAGPPDEVAACLRDVDAHLRDQLGAAATTGLPVLVDAFREEVPSLLRELAAALASGDRAALGEHAHALRGMAAMVGARAVAERGAVLERAARDGDLAQLGRYVDGLRTLLDALCPRLAELEPQRA